MQTFEMTRCEGGMLTLTRDDGKLIKVSYNRFPPAIADIDMLGLCKYCATPVDMVNGYWQDTAGTLTCIVSPDDLHMRKFDGRPLTD